MKYTEQQLIDAHRHTMRNRAEIEASNMCACFDCGKTFPSCVVTAFIDDGQTAMCPHCGMDTVIGDASGISLDENFLKAMRRRWM